jgi:transcription elongation factor Elf1
MGRRRRKHRPPPTVRKDEPTCPLCGEPAHQGDSEESLVSLAVLDEEAAVYYDHQVANHAATAGLCGPRFRATLVLGLLAHYGSPRGQHYVVFRWVREPKSWTLYLDSHLADRNIIPGG